MGRYVVRRLLGLVIVLLGMTTLTFFISQVVPSNPAAVMAGRYATEEQIRELEQRLGLDRPVVEQYWDYLTRLVLHGDFGYSYYERRPVAKAVMTYLPASLELAFASFLLAVPLGIGLGWFPLTGRIATGVPLPPAVTGFYLVDSLLARNASAFLSSLRHLVLPSVTLACGNILVLTRMTRSAMLDVLSQGYIRTARSKGLSERVVLYKHALRNAMIPVVTVMGMQLAQLIGWVFLTEVIFAWPGLGTQAVRAIMALDVPTVIGSTLLVALIYMLLNLVVDVLYVFIDPRIRY